MPALEGIFPITTKPGIKRDGTAFDGNNYTFGQWCRFQTNGRPRKIRGYQNLVNGWTGPVRGAFLDGALVF